VRRLGVATLLLLAAGCGSPVAQSRYVPVRPPQRSSPTPTASPTTGPPGTACTAPADDPHVYHPDRLAFLGCRTAAGTVDVIRSEPDGDNHTLLKLDPAYAGLLDPANQGKERGDLVLEQPCDHAVTQADAVAGCEIGGEPRFSFTVGEHVQVTGAWVADVDHGGWHEFHPLTTVAPLG